MATFSLRAWAEGVPLDVVEDDLDERPIALCLSGGGFRSFSCVTGQLRALIDRGVMANVGLVSAVSGGAWAAATYAYTPGPIRDRLGEVVDPSKLTLEGLAATIDERHLAFPVTEMDALSHARGLGEEDIAQSQLFSRVLGDQLLSPLGIDTGLPVLAASDDHISDLVTRNPHLDRNDVLTPVPGRVPVITGASMMFRDVDEDGGSSRYRYVPVDLTPSAVSTAWPVDDWPVRSIELPALTGTPRTAVEAGLVDVDVDEWFGLPDLLAATGGAPGGVLVEIAAMLGLRAEHLVLQAAHWLGLDTTPLLVDGGYVENTGILGALRRGADRLIVLVNSNVGLGSRLSPFTVEGLEGQIARLFGRTPTLGLYAREPLALFEEDELPALAEALAAAKERGEMPWTLGDHRLREDNVLGLPPRPVRVYWQLNEVPSAWAEQLPDETQRSLATPFADLHRVPHLPVAFAQVGWIFRLRPTQIAAMVTMHDHALRSRPDEVWQALLAGPGGPLPGIVR